MYDLPTRTDITWGTRSLRQLPCRHIWWRCKHFVYSLSKVPPDVTCGFFIYNVLRLHTRIFPGHYCMSIKITCQHAFFFFRTCMSKKMHVNMRPLFLMFGTVEGKGSLESFHISRTNDMHGSRQELDDNEQRIQPRTKQERGGRA